MRLIIDTLVALMLTAILAGGVVTTRRAQEAEESVDVARAQVRAVQQEILLRAALGEIETTPRGFPVTVDPEWFGDALPSHPLLDESHPWIEIAGAGQAELMHPPNRVALDRGDARFWYNPATGKVRARVPSGISDADALALYNAINQCSLPSLFADGRLEHRAAPGA